MARSGSAWQLKLPLLCVLLIALSSAEVSAAVLNATAAPPTAMVTSVNINVTNATTNIVTTTITTTIAQTTANAAAAAQTGASAAATTGATKPKHLCAFPFWYRDEWRHECIEYGTKGARWCALTQNFTRDELWQECSRYELMRYKCTIPFHYQGKQHSECQPLGLEPSAKPTFWCALVPSLTDLTWAGLGTDWVFCESPLATDITYKNFVGVHENIAEAAAAMRLSVAVTPAGTAAAAAAGTSARTGPPTGTAAAAAAATSARTGLVTTGLRGDAKATALEAPKAISGSSGGSAPVASSDGSSDPAATAGSPSLGLGITLGVVGVVLAAVAVAAALIVHRRNQYKRIDPLLSSDPVAEKSSYGGMQAYHD